MIWKNKFKLVNWYMYFSSSSIEKLIAFIYCKILCKSTCWPLNYSVMQIFPGCRKWRHHDSEVELRNAASRDHERYSKICSKPRLGPFDSSTAKSRFSKLLCAIFNAYFCLLVNVSQFKIICFISICIRKHNMINHCG